MMGNKLRDEGDRRCPMDNDGQGRGELKKEETKTWPGIEAFIPVGA